MSTLLLRDLPKFEAIRSRAAQYPEVDPDAVESFLVLLRVAGDVLNEFEDYLAGHNMSQGSFTVLMVLHRDPDRAGLNPSDLAAKCGVTRATMTGLLDGLERKNLVRREHEQTDRRTCLVKLTRGGADLLESMLHDYYKKIALVMGPLELPEKRQLIDHLMKVSATLPEVFRS